MVILGGGSACFVLQSFLELARKKGQKLEDHCCHILVHSTAYLGKSQSMPGYLVKITRKNRLIQNDFSKISAESTRSRALGTPWNIQKEKIGSGLLFKKKPLHLSQNTGIIN